MGEGGVEVWLCVLFTSALGGGEWSAIHPRCCTHRKATLVPTGQALEFILIQWRREKLLLVFGIAFRFSDHPTCSLVSILTELWKWICVYLMMQSVSHTV
jgi:hypothetical protein